MSSVGANVTVGSMATLLPLFGCQGVVELGQCDGTTNLYDMACLDMTTTDLSYCRCQLCQIYTQRDVFGVSPDNSVNSITTTHLQPGRESVHTLCLNHWTFFRIDTTPPASNQLWVDQELGVSSSISAALGAEPSTPQTLLLTLDTTYNEDAERFTTVDAFLHLSPTLPDNWFHVHHTAVVSGTLQEYPRSVFTDASTYVELLQQDAFTYTLGPDDSSATCSTPLPSGAMYLAVRCGAPNANAPDVLSWRNQDEPCSFRVRYTLVPQSLTHADVLGPLPIAPGTFHSYSVTVGGYDVRLPQPSHRLPPSTAFHSY